MRNKKHSVKTFFITIVIVFLTGLIDSLPWWSFIIPIALLGILLNFLKWNISSFSIGFLAGFIIWSGTNFYLDRTGNGIMLNKISELLLTNKFVLLMVAGVIGGLLSGLALYTGTSALSWREHQD